MTLRKRLFTALLLLVVALGVAGLAILSQLREPSYNGKSLTEWLHVLARATHEEKTNAQHAVRSIGSNAIPTLVRLAQSKDTSWKRAIRSAIQKQSIADIDIESPESLRIQAAVGFSVLGESAAPAIPSLVELLDDEETYEHAVMSLLAVGTAGVHQVTRMLTNAVPARAGFAVAGLMRLGLDLGNTNLVERRATLERNADVAVAPLVDCLKNPSFPFRSTAARALGLIGRHPDTVIPALSNTLATTTSSNEVVGSTIYALARFGRTARPTSPVIQPFLLHSDEEIRRAATNALARINRDEPRQ